MSDCRDFRSAWTSLDPSEPLPAPLARHLASCARCRALAAEDPSRLFAALRGVSPEPAPAWERMRGAIAAAPAGAQIARRTRRAWGAAAAAAILLAGALWLLRPGLVGPRPGAGGESPAPAGEEVEGVAHAASLPTLESIASPGARVVDFKIFGERDEVTEVILIFDEGIDL